LELREPSQAGCVWVRSPKIGSSLECGVLPFFSPLPPPQPPAPSHKHLLALYSFTLCRIIPPKLLKADLWRKVAINKRKMKIKGKS
jgi:hypothetical protein